MYRCIQGAIIMKNILIIGKNAYLADGLCFNRERFNIDFVARSHEVTNWNKYDTVINFCIQPEHFSRLLNEEEMIDVQIAKNLNKNTKFIFLSSRKVYGSSTELKEYKETDTLKPFDFYSKNKVNIEKKLKEMLDSNLLILRTSNIIGLPPKKNSPTFVSWLASELNNSGIVTVTADKFAKKDYITKKYFQETLVKIVSKDLSGIYNLGANFAYTTEELLKMLVPEDKLKFSPKEEKGEQFILNCKKIHGVVPALTTKEFAEECKIIKKTISERY